MWTGPLKLTGSSPAEGTGESLRVLKHLQIHFLFFKSRPLFYTQRNDHKGMIRIEEVFGLMAYFY